MESLNTLWIPSNQIVEVSYTKEHKRFEPYPKIYMQKT